MEEESDVCMVFNWEIHCVRRGRVGDDDHDATICLRHTIQEEEEEEARLAAACCRLLPSHHIETDDRGI